MTTDNLQPGTRIRVIGGPWPERIEAEGQVATPPGDWGDVYPVHGLGLGEVLILLDDDPIRSVHAPEHAWWTCAIYRANVEVLNGD